VNDIRITQVTLIIYSYDYHVRFHLHTELRSNFDSLRKIRTVLYHRLTSNNTVGSCNHDYHKAKLQHITDTLYISKANTNLKLYYMMSLCSLQRKLINKGI
jgi:hypothetical protein